MSERGSGITGRLARAAARRPKRAIGLWLVAVVVSIGLVGSALHGLTSTGTATGTTGSGQAAAALARAFPVQARRQTSDVIVLHSTGATVALPAFSQTVARLEADLRRIPDVRNVNSYLDGAPGLVSANRHAALVRLSVSTDSQIKPVVALVQRTSGHAGITAGMTGDHTVGNDFATLSQHDLSHGELAFGLPAALVVLVLVFGTVVAGLVPLVLAMLSIIVGLGMIAVLSQFFTLSTFVVNMLTGMGLALGIDYSLFVLSRYREERARGLSKLDAIEQAGSSASRAVLFSGSTFVVAMFGMLIVRTSVMRSLAAGAIVVGIISVAAALTLLPALLSLLGDRVNSLRVPSLRRRREAVPGQGAESRFWAGVVTSVLRRPALSLTVSVVLMLLAAAPLLGLHIGASGVTTLPSASVSRQGYELLTRSFPAQNPYPVQIAAVGGNGRVRTDMLALRNRLAADPQFGPGQVAVSPRAGVVALQVPIKGDPVASRQIAAVRQLRSTTIPDTFAGSGARVYVGGQTARNVDYFDAVTTPTPYVLAFVLGLSFIVLLIGFRSVTISLVSILLNLLSVGAAYGLLTLVFIHGVGSSLFGFEHVRTIEAWVPLFLFSVLFGLSMDYQVFLMSRIKERHDHGDLTREAVTRGVSSTARIITGAALIIIVVFAGFASGELVMFQQMGFGVAVALLLDATVIRSVVLPSLLVLLGERAWYLPRWLEWLPKVGIEAAESEPAPRPGRTPRFGAAGLTGS